MIRKQERIYAKNRSEVLQRIYSGAHYCKTGHCKITGLKIAIKRGKKTAISNKGTCGVYYFSWQIWRVNCWKSREAMQGYAFPGDPLELEKQNPITGLTPLGEKLFGLKK